MTEVFLGAGILAALALYCVSAGADFGGGVWDLLASGPRAAQQRALISRSIAPVWEANHVWLIAVIVMLFSAFPAAFAAFSTALHIPLTVMLIGIVLRGSAFVFRSFEPASPRSHQRWSRIFAVASALTPIALGVCVGAIAAGRVPTHMTDRGIGSFIRPWLDWFPLCVGLLTLALFAFLAAVYLTVETEDQALRDDFRSRGLWAGGTTGVLAWLSFTVAKRHAPLIAAGLSSSEWAAPFHGATAAVAIAALSALWMRSFRAARVCAVVQTMLLVLGWGLAQYPYLVPPELTFSAAAAPASVLGPLSVAAAVAALAVAPAFAWLYWIFKRRGAER